MADRVEVPLTSEDLQAWSYCYRFSEGDAWDSLMINTRICDHRDADLMWQAQRSRGFGEFGYLPTLAQLPHDPYPYVGGIKLGRRANWEVEQVALFDET